jgi:hypothetical protein
MIGRCPDHESRSDVAGASVGAVGWQYEAGILTSPVVGADGTVYVMSSNNDSGELLAIAPPGVLEWSFPFTGAIGGAPALAADGTVYFVAGAVPGTSQSTTTLSAVTSAGALVWTLDLEALPSEPFGGGPIVGSDGMLYVTTSDTLFAVHPDGGVAWKYPFPVNTSSRGAPAIGPNGRVYVSLLGDSNLVAVDPSGNESWEFSIIKIDPRKMLGADVYASPVIGPDGTAYIATTQCNAPTTVYAIDPGGNLRWMTDFGAYGDVVMGAPAVAEDGSIVVVNQQGGAARLSAEGAVLWTLDINANVYSSVALGADGTAYVGSAYPGAALHAISAKGAILWSLALGSDVGDGAIAANGHIVVTSGKVLFDIR